jgi:hypothetical protein
MYVFVRVLYLHTCRPYGDVDGIHLAQGRVQWWPTEKKEMENVSCNFFYSCADLLLRTALSF